MTTAGATSEGLYTLNTIDGTASQVGKVTSFGVTEIAPQSLATDGTRLWMVGSDAILYTVNRITGQATQVGSVASGFGVNETDPRVLLYVGTAGSGRLYMIGRSRNSLYEIRLPSGQGTWNRGSGVDVGGALQIYESRADQIANCNDLAIKGSHVYATYNGDTIARLDLATGDRTRVLNTGHRLGLTNITGLANHASANTFYFLTSTSTGNGTLYTASITGSGHTRIGSSDGLVGVPNTKGILNFNGASAPSAANPLYMVSPSDNGSLYTLDTSSNGTANKVEVANFNLSTREEDPVGLAYGNSTLYMLGQNPPGNTTRSGVYTIDPSTGVATKDGVLLQQLDVLGLHFYNDGTNNNLYTFGTFAGALRKITLPTTGTAPTRGYSTAQVGTGVGSGETRPYSLTTVGTGANTVHYLVGFDTDRLLKLNLSTGAAFNNGLAPGFGQSITEPRALVSDGTNLYLVTDSSIHTFNLTANSTNLGAVGAATNITGMVLARGLARISTTTYITGGTTADNTAKGLFSINLGSGAATRIGSATQFDANENNPQGLARHGSTLYMVGQANASLYSISSSTGIATQISSITAIWSNEAYTNGKFQATLTFIGSDVIGIAASDFEVRTSADATTTGWVFDTPSTSATAGNGITIAVYSTLKYQWKFQITIKTGQY